MDVVQYTVEAYDLSTHQRRWSALLAPEPALASLRGVLPFGLALSPDGARLFVAESGINAVGVLDATTGAVLGHVATGWYPSRVAVSPDGQRLYVSNAKGFGAGPNGGRGYVEGPEGSYVGNLMKGLVTTDLARCARIRSSLVTRGQPCSSAVA